MGTFKIPIFATFAFLSLNIGQLKDYKRLLGKITYKSSNINKYETWSSVSNSRLGSLPVYNLFFPLQRLSYIEEHLTLKIVFHERSSSIKSITYVNQLDGTTWLWLNSMFIIISMSEPLMQGNCLTLCMSGKIDFLIVIIISAVFGYQANYNDVCQYRCQKKQQNIVSNISE